MKAHFIFSDTEFLRQFESTILDPVLFNHEAHLRLAWLNIKRFGIETALIATCDQLLAYVTKLGAKDKFNTTLTIAAIKAVYHFMLKSKTDNFKDFIEEFPRLRDNFKDLMAAHYGFDIYQSEEAKKMYLAPDLLPFD